MRKQINYTFDEQDYKEMRKLIENVKDYFNNENDYRDAKFSINRISKIFNQRSFDLYRPVLKEIIKVYEYGQEDNEGEIMIEIEDTCDLMYEIAKKGLNEYEV